MSYTTLPAEILTHMAQYADVPSAISLAQTSSFSQQAAESRIYDTIQITHIDRFALPNQQNPNKPDDIHYVYSLPKDPPC
jgi:hypothetical protein